MALWLVLEWYGATSEVAWLFLLGLWVLALVFASAAYAAWNRTGLSLRIAAGTNAPADGSPLEDLPAALIRAAPYGTPLFEAGGAALEVGLDTRRTARGPAWVEGRIDGKPFRLGTGLVPVSGWRRTLELTDLRRGPLGASGWSIGTSDPLGFYVSRRRWPDAEVAVVYPRFASLAHRRPVRELETAAAVPRAGSGTEPFGIREYRPGDSLRRIHWRSSARRSELVVREFEPPGVQTVTIAVDPDPPTREMADQIARIAASEAWDCLREGGRVRLGAIESRDLWELLDWLARYPAVDFGDPTPRPDVVVTADPELIAASAMRNWLVGDAAVDVDLAFERVGTQWPL